MNTASPANSRGIWSRLLIMAGSGAMLLGAIDPLEGSVVILPGSGLVALGTYLEPSERRWLGCRLWTFILIAIGVGAMWGLTAVGGFGGKTGRSMWWGLLILPYLVGWSIGIWGPGSPRWVLLLGIGVGLWYCVILAMILRSSGVQHGGQSIVPGLIIAALGLVTIGGCIIRLYKRSVPQNRSDRNDA